MYSGEEVAHYVRGVLRDPTLFLFLEPVLTPVALIRNERAKLPVAFVYGPDDRVSYWYVVTDSSPGRYWWARHSPVSAVKAQLDQGGGPAWSAILTSFAGEARQRAACVGYVFTLIDEANLLQALTLATEVDEGQRGIDEARSKMETCMDSALDYPCASEPR